MEDPKRLVLAFALVMLILFLWQVLFLPKEPVKKMKEEITSNLKAPAQVPAKAEAVPRGEEWQLENEKLLIKFSNYGATIRSVYLKEYRCELLKGDNYFSLRIRDGNQEFSLDTIIWSVKQESARITFSCQDSHFLITRSYSLEDDYQLSMTITEKPLGGVATAPRNFLLTFDRGLAFTEKDTGEEYNHFRILLMRDKEFSDIPIQKIKGVVKERGNLSWLGFTTKYFLLVIRGKIDSLLFQPSLNRRIKSEFFLTSEPEGEARLYLAFYPLKYPFLAQKGAELKNAVRLGWPRFLSLAILRLLLLLHSLLKNYGLVIIIFSFLMKGLLFPLTRFQLKEMKKWQQLQPKIEELKKRYKDDPKTLNQEMMRLYRVHQMNPLSGCLPLLFQIPIFWALYSVLRSTFELRQASFVFWLKDLSQKDPFYVLPVLMGLSFLFQNLLTSQDKKNLFMTFFFPIFLTVIFLNFPSGLQLYWLTFNLLSLVESFIVYRGGKIWKR
jgi:YidC/Oxa1 family membrane protein insertase